MKNPAMDPEEYFGAFIWDQMNSDSEEDEEQNERDYEDYVEQMKEEESIRLESGSEPYSFYGYAG